MVAACVPRLGCVPKLCLARPMLFAALECHDRGDLIGAGVRLRESVVRFIVAAADWYGVEVPTAAKFPKPADYIRALRRAKHIDRWGASILIEAIDRGNKAAHCQRVDANEIEGSISLVFALMDGEPYCPFERQPIVTPGNTDGDSGDDDDSNSWTKGGAK